MILKTSFATNKLKGIDLPNNNNLIKPAEVSTGFAVGSDVKKLKRKNVVNSTYIKVFKKAAQKFLVALAEKLLKRISLVSSLLQTASAFDPQNVLQLSKEKAIDLSKACSLISYS